MIQTILIALIPVSFGIAVTWLIGAPARKKAKLLTDAQLRIAQLEEEKAKRELIDRFEINHEVENNVLKLTADQEFTLVSIDYLTQGGIKILNEPVDKAGSRLVLPLNDHAKFRQVQRHGCNPEDGSFPMNFRFNLVVLGKNKTHTIPAMIMPMFQGSTTYWNVTA